MEYLEPKKVTSPQANIKQVRPIIDYEEGEWSAALLKWDNRDAIGLRCNGWTVPGKDKPHPGNPQSRDIPTWFIIPNELNVAVLLGLKDHIGKESNK